MSGESGTKGTVPFVSWDFAIGLLRMDGLEPTEDFKEYIELEKQGKVTDQDLKEYLNKKYRRKRIGDMIE